MPARRLEILRAEAPELEPYLRVRDRDLARSEPGIGGGSDGRFVAEGEVVVRVLASARQTRFKVQSLLLEQRRVEALRDVLEGLGDDVPAYVAPQDVMNAVVGFAIHRGILAIGERGPGLTPGDVLSGGGLAVGLVGLTNHDNVGSIFRNAAAFGARGVLLDAATCDPLYRKSIRVSVGGALVVPFARCGSPDAMLDVIEGAGWETLALTGRGEETLGEVVRGGLPAGVGGRVLLLGTEGEGLPEGVLARTQRVRIDMTPMLDSLNVAVASGIALYEASRAMRGR